MTEIYDAAVAGGGFSGLMTVANLARLAPAARVAWIDPVAPASFGLAYATREDIHLLNVPAGKMGAWEHRHGDFFDWLERACPGLYMETAFAPRLLYGAYLRSIYDALPEGAKARRGMAVAAKRLPGGHWAVGLEDGKTIEARHLVAATGNPPMARPDWPEGGVFVDDFWRWRLRGGKVERADGLVVIAGAGLTAMDAALGVIGDGFRGRILCLSPHGRAPEIHAPVSHRPDPSLMMHEMSMTRSCRHYLRVIRRYAGDGDAWRGAIDALRPHVTPLWQALPENEKKRFMRHLWSRWNIRRHRMAPAIKARLDAFGRLEIAAGRVVKAEHPGLVTIRRRGASATETLEAALVLNCTGPSYRRLAADNPLLSSLAAGGWLSPGPLGLGVAEPVSPGLHVIGTPLLGARLETTAVPELRTQAAEIAARVAAE